MKIPIRWLVILLILPFGFGSIGVFAQTSGYPAHLARDQDHCMAVSEYRRVLLNPNGTVIESTWNGDSWTGYARVKGLSSIVAVDCGARHAVALRADKTVWVWGDNTQGQLGLGDTVDRNIPEKIRVGGADLDRVVAISTGLYTSYALKEDGSVLAWGRNGTDGALGIGSEDSMRTSPEVIPSLDNVRMIAAGDTHFLALKMDGSVWGCGSNAQAEIKAEWLSAYKSVVKIDAVGSSVVQIAAGTELSLALNSDGTAWSWGSNVRGQQGRRTPHYYYDQYVGNQVAKPKLIPDPSLETPPTADQEVSLALAWKNIVQIKAGGTLALAVVKDPATGARGLWTWGYGGGITHDSSTQIDGSYQSGSNYPAYIGAHEPASLELGHRTILAAFDAPGEISDMRMGSANSIAEEPPVLTSHLVSVLVHQTVQLKKIASGIPTDFADSHGDLRTAGWHTASKVPLAVPLPYAHRVASVGASFWSPTDPNNFAQTFYANLYLTEDFKLMRYRTGAVASNGYTLLSFPHSEIASIGSNVVSIATHAYPQSAEKLFVALLANGTVKMLSGVYVGRANAPAAYTLVQQVPLEGMTDLVDVSSLGNIIRISVGQNHCGAIDRNGDVWMWGKNNNGQLGDGTTLDRATPIKVTVPQGASFLACGRFTTHVIARDGKVYAWGNGYLGRENVAFPHFSASPVEITNLSGRVTSIHCGFEGGGSATMKRAHYLAIGRNGGVYAWGFNGQGRLGDTTIGGERTAPYLLPHDSMTNIVEVYAAAQTSLFRREDGKVYGCGNNNNALIGNGAGYIMGESTGASIWYASPELSQFTYYP